MTWGKMDDKAHRNKKVRKLYRMGAKGREAYGVWTFRWSWCLDDPDLTGFVPEEELDAGELRAAELLCSDLHEGRGLWVKVEGGYKFHDFHEYNPTKDQVERKKKYDRDRKKSEPTPTPGGFRADSETTPNGIAEESFPTRVSHSHSHSHPNQTPVVPEPDNAQHDRSPMRFRQLLEDEVRSEFFRRNETPQKAHDSQWRDGCQTVQDALKLSLFPDAQEAIGVFAGLLVDACTRREKPEKLGFALQQTTLSRREPEPITAMVYRIREGA